MPNRTIIKNSLFWLGLAGCDPKNPKKILAFLSSTLISAVLILAFLEGFLTWKGLNTVAEVVATITPTFQGICKIAALMIHREELVKILEALNDFWELDKFGKRFGKKVKSTYELARGLNNWFVCLGWLVVLLFFGEPFFTKEKKLPFTCYVPGGIEAPAKFEIALFLEFVSFVLLATLLLGFDTLLFGLITHASCEFSMVAEGFRTLRKTGQWKEYASLVDHHNLILNLVRSLNKIYSVLLLVQFLTSMFAICMGIFLLHVDGAGLNSSYASYVLGFLFQLGLYCIGGEQITEQSVEVAGAAFDSEWWLEFRPELSRNALIVIQRAQRVESITVGGMANLNLECYTRIIKNAVSFFTLMQAMEERYDQSNLA